MNRDNIYSVPLEKVGDFAFDQHVVDVFPDMISRSVPGYGSILSMIGEVASQYAVENTNIYDLGCSLGAATMIIRQRVPSSCTIHAVDASDAMIARFRKTLADQSSAGCTVALHETDLALIPIQQASLVVLNFTLQFVPAADRHHVLGSICKGMVAGGALVLSEKVCFEDPSEQQRLTELHHAFKRANGYSELEIAQKRTALEKMMVPESIAVHRQRLADVGFTTIVPWFQCFNFVSILAIK